MNVTLLNHTPDPMALDLLLKTKGTRLGSEDDPRTWSADKKRDHLAYMLDTIKSSWEFLDYTFEISGVTRAFTHQLVRTRAGAYAQESQRTVDVRDHEVAEPDSVMDFYEKEVGDPPREKMVSGPRMRLWDDAVGQIRKSYSGLIDLGVPVQDARGILPTNMTTAIICKLNLRTLHDMAKVRLCVRTQGEYQTVFRMMRASVVSVHPWTEDFINVSCVQDGICAFPRYGKAECPIYDPRMDLTQLKADTKAKFWGTAQHVAIPVARDGKTQ